VFSLKELLLFIAPSEVDTLKRRLHYYVKTGAIHRIRKGFYAKDSDYNRKEFAVRLYPPSYISFETVLFEQGVIFQWYETLFVASYQTRMTTADDKSYQYRRIKDEILLNDVGVVQHETYAIATKERAFLDLLYLSPGYFVDNLFALDRSEVEKILPIYQNKRLEREVARLFALRDKDRPENQASCTCKNTFSD
jgi:hypothetical protein